MMQRPARNTGAGRCFFMSRKKNYNFLSNNSKKTSVLAQVFIWFFGVY